MLPYLLAFVVAVAGLALYATAFFFPNLYRKNDLIWSGVALFYGLVLWFCAKRLTGAVLLGQTASVALLGWLGFQAFQLRWSQLPSSEQASIADGSTVKQRVEQLKTTNWKEVAQTTSARVKDVATGAAGVAAGAAAGLGDVAQNVKVSPSEGSTPIAALTDLVVKIKGLFQGRKAHGKKYVRPDASNAATTTYEADWDALEESAPEEKSPDQSSSTSDPATPSSPEPSSSLEAEAETSSETVPSAVPAPSEDAAPAPEASGAVFLADASVAEQPTELDQAEASGEPTMVADLAEDADSLAEDGDSLAEDADSADTEAVRSEDAPEETPDAGLDGIAKDSDSEPADSEPADLGSSDSGSTDSESTDSESADSESSDSESSDSEPTDLDPAEPGFSDPEESQELFEEDYSQEIQEEDYSQEPPPEGPVVP